MASRIDGVVKEKRFVFRDCDHKPIAYRVVARAAGFKAAAIQGRMVVNIELYPSKPLRRARKSGGPRSRRRTRGR